ncbi:unnamed protein product, partial [Scytosiphon promiscuus]
ISCFARICPAKGPKASNNVCSILGLADQVKDHYCVHLLCGTSLGKNLASCVAGCVWDCSLRGGRYSGAWILSNHCPISATRHGVGWTTNSDESPSDDCEEARSFCFAKE